MIYASTERLCFRYLEGFTRQCYKSKIYNVLISILLWVCNLLFSILGHYSKLCKSWFMHSAHGNPCQFFCSQCCFLTFIIFVQIAMFISYIINKYIYTNLLQGMDSYPVNKCTYRTWLLFWHPESWLLS